MKPKKLIRDNMPNNLEKKEYEKITDKDELNRLYALKVKEELNEIQMADHSDPKEFSDLVEVSLAFAEQNGFPLGIIADLIAVKNVEKGKYTNMALTNMNPNNPSNKMYFQELIPKLSIIKVPNESYGYFINKVGCLKYYVMHGTVEQSSSVSPEVIGDYLETTKHELVGHVFVYKQKYILYKTK
jgi:predicted house-cleaning noncanonical NTP pyrophosphatase (MazG superfamily)